MSLDTLLEAARYLEYQAQAQTRGEIPKDYSTFSSSAASELSPLASSPPSPPPVPPPSHHHHLPAATNGLCSYSPPSSSASSSPPPVPYSRPPSPPPTHPTPPADSLRDDSPPFLSSHRPTPLLPSSSPILHNHLNQGQLYHRPLSPRSAPPSPSSTIPTSSHNSPFHDFQTDPSSYALQSESELGGGGGESGGGGVSGGISSSSPSRSFRRITVSSQLARLEEAQELRRRVGSGTREVHNKLEKNRRAHLKECFELLKKQLPASQEEKKSSNLSILHSALRYIQTLKRKERDYEHEMERLAREKIASQQRLSALKKELSAQWDHIDFNTLLPQESAPGGGGSPRRLPCDDEEDECVKGADGIGAFEDSIMSRKDLRLPITSDHNSNSTSTASERGHLSDDDMLSSSSRGASSVAPVRAQQQLARHSFPLGVGKRSPRPIMHGGSAPASPTPSVLPPPPPQRSSVLQQHRLALPSSTPPSSPAHTPPPKPAPGSPRPPRHFSPSRQMVPPDMMHHHPEEEVGIAVTAIPAAHVPAQVVRTSHGLATALVSPSAAIHLLTTPSQRHHDAASIHHHTGAHGGLHHLHVPPLSHSSPNSPKTASPNSSPSSPSSPLLLGGHHSQQPLALTVHGHPSINSHFHHSSQGLSLAHKSRDQDAKTSAVSSTTATAAISVPTIHLAGKVVQHPVAFLGTPTTTTTGSQEVSHELEGAITSSSSSGKFGSHHHHHHLHQQPTIAIAGGSIALPNGVVAHASSASAGVSLARAVSPGNSARGSLPTPLTLAHSPNSGGTTTMLTTAIHGAGTTPISALPTHLAPAGVTHLLTPLAGGHAALVTTSGGGAGHPLMTPLALVSSTGGPVAAHILGAASASSSGSVGAGVAGKVMASSTAGAIPLLKPVAMGGQLPLMNAQYLTTAALGGIAHLVKPLVVVSSAPSAPNHGSGPKLPSSLTSRSESSTPQ